MSTFFSCIDDYSVNLVEDKTGRAVGRLAAHALTKLADHGPNETVDSESWLCLRCGATLLVVYDENPDTPSRSLWRAPEAPLTQQPPLANLTGQQP